MWRQSRKYVKAVLNLITAVVILLFVVFVVPSVISYFMPFVIGWIIAMIANPLVRFSDEKIKIRRKAGSAIVIIAVIAAIVAGIYGILSLLAGQLKGFVEELPGLWKAMESDISNAGNSLESFSHYFSPNVQEQVARILNSLMKLLSSAVDHMGSPTGICSRRFCQRSPDDHRRCHHVPVILLFLRCAAGRSDCCVSQICTGELPQKVGCDVSQSDRCHWRIFQSTAKDRDLGISSDAGGLFDPAGALRCADFDRDCDSGVSAGIRNRYGSVAMGSDQGAWRRL